MPNDGRDTQVLLQRAGQGDCRALSDLLMRFRERLRFMVRLRLDRRLRGRIDDSVVL